jgi:uncharacterized membrane protein YdjX (TVP38/TMEM64 family)
MCGPPPGRLSVRTRWWLKLVALLGASGVGVSLVALYVPVKAYAAVSMAWIQSNPTWGALVLPLVLCVSIPLWVPSTLFEILAGCVFGIWAGGLLSIVGKTAGSLLAYAIGKRFGRDALHKYMQARFPAFAVLLSILQNASMKLLVLLQLANVPHSAKCYGLAVADVSTLRFTISTVVGAVPYAILWAYLGHQSKNLMAGTEGNTVVALNAASSDQQRLIGISGALFTVVSMGWLVVYTKKELRAEMLKHQQRSKSQDEVEQDELWLDIFEENDQETDEDDAPLVVKAKRSASCSCSSSIKQRSTAVLVV